MTAQFRILAISGSLRARSSNTDTLRAAALVAPESVTIRLYDGLGRLPHFNPDLDGEGAVLPDSVREFRSEIGEADALLVCSPEYAHGVPGSLKNALDWLVSSSEMLYKPIGLINVSPRSTHATASLAETLRTMSTVLVEGALLELPLAGKGIDDAGIAADPRMAAALTSAVDALVVAAVEYRQRRAEFAH
jgi:chromate reductase, NAD(P)H dehydrogenase (quinone)